ncbi:DsrE family protein [Lactococcus garvieae]|uniref:DsrE family protein n=1 Tax=Lactococcus garvieae TaxID=1363 RepID=UPI0009C08881|nr:DsrE family protein [Lactococcus garvieae]QPS71798.1 DsrE family protein [Lactococcus garvieae]
MLKVILHINENQKWKAVLSNVENFQSWLSENKEAGDIEILVNGEAVDKVLQGSTINLSEVLQTGVKVAVCQNSLNARAYTTEMLQEGCTVVPAGIVELVQKQHLGFAYIKP